MTSEILQASMVDLASSQNAEDDFRATNSLANIKVTIVSTARKKKYKALLPRI